MAPLGVGRALRRVAALLSSVALLAGCAAAPPPKPLPGLLPPYSEGGNFVITGDVQRTSLLEFWREQNDAERGLLIRAIAAGHPAFVALTGDLVFDGSSARQWAELDELMAPIRDAGIPVVAALGNHEYWGGRGGAAHFFARFPHLANRHHYAIAWGPVRLVILDSNVAELSSTEWREQRTWYEGTLATFDADPTVRGALVLLHHPPYTNSTVTADEPEVQRDLVPAFLAAKKTLAMISGHVHGYERFLRGGKTFLVNGGGGGPRAPLMVGRGRRHEDDMFAGPALRDFEFARFSVGAAGLEAEVIGIPKGGDSFRAMDRFELPFR